jgi:hypothetical protein
MHITKEEERALKFTEEATHAWREEHDIPGTEACLKCRQKKYKKEADLTQFPHLFLSVMTKKKSEDIFYTRVNNFLILVYRRNCKFLCCFAISNHLWPEMGEWAQPHSHPLRASHSGLGNI